MNVDSTGRTGTWVVVPLSTTEESTEVPVDHAPGKSFWHAKCSLTGVTWKQKTCSLDKPIEKFRALTHVRAPHGEQTSSAVSSGTECVITWRCARLFEPLGRFFPKRSRVAQFRRVQYGLARLPEVCGRYRRYRGGCQGVVVARRERLFSGSGMNILLGDGRQR
jgi:hypothetical protein